MTWEDEDICPVCKIDEIVLPHGNRNSSILVIGEFPNDEDIKKGIPFASSSGTVLRQELGYFGVDLQSTRRCYLWIHTPNKNKSCFDYGLNLCIQNAKDKKIILLLGSEPVKLFTGEKVTDVNGLQVQSNYFSAPIIMACIHPSSVFNSPVGELRFALKNFANKVKELGL